MENGLSIRATDMPGADDLMVRVYAAMAQKERELISERTRAALAAARARGAVLGGDRGWRPPAPPCPTAATTSRCEQATRVAHRLALELERLRAEGIAGQTALARALNERGVLPPAGRGAWTHTTVARVMRRLAPQPGLAGSGRDRQRRAGRCSYAAVAEAENSCHPSNEPWKPLI